MDRFTTISYLSGPETLRRRELVWGVLREPPAPLYGHQRAVTDLACLLQEHTRVRALGQVCVSPIDVVLDARKALIVQPDIIFVSSERLDLIRGQVWGAPDLVVEVLSRGTAAYDRRRKLGWFKKYGVRECWLVDNGTRQITVHSFDERRSTKATYHLAHTLRSNVLPELRLRLADVFGA